MKKLIILFILLGIVGCSKEKVVLNDETVRAQADVVVEALLNQDEKIKDYLSKNFKAEIPGSTLLLVFKEHVNNLQYEGIENNYLYKNTCTYHYLKYTEKTVKVFMCFNDELLVDKLVINDLSLMPELVSNEYYEEIAITIGKEPKLNAVLTLPKNVEKPKVVVMAQGSGPSDLNETIYENKPFEDIARGLATYGVASVRFDKRTYAFPESMDLEFVTVDEEYLYDIAGAIHSLENYAVDPFGIYYLGHSQGAMLAFYIMNEHPELKGAILLAGSPRSLIDISISQNEAVLKAQGLSDSAVETALKDLYADKELIDNLTENSEHTTILGMNSEYWFSLKKTEMHNFVEPRGKYLILQGEVDQQVYLDVDFAMFKELFESNKNVVLKSYPNLNHLFMYSETGNIDEYQVKSYVSDEVIYDMVRWLNGEDILKEVKR